MSVALGNWALQSIEADRAWEQGFYGQGVVVALIGSGVDITNPSLVGRFHNNFGEMGLDRLGRDRRFNGVDDDQNGFEDDWSGFDFVAGTGRFMDPSLPTDTHVAGVLAANHNNQQVQEGQVQGVAPGAMILPINFVDQSAGASPEDITAAIDYAVLRGAKIINISWSLTQETAGLRDKIQSLANQGILVVTAAGNMAVDVDRFLVFPAEYNLPFQVTVGAHQEQGFLLAPFSNFGRDRVHLVAPGNNVLTSVIGGSGTASGTAIAGGLVSGVAAVLWSAYPQATVDDIMAALLVGTTEEASYSGLTWTQGRLSMQGALDYLASKSPASTDEGSVENDLGTSQPSHRDNDEDSLEGGLDTENSGSADAGNNDTRDRDSKGKDGESGNVSNELPPSESVPRVENSESPLDNDLENSRPGARDQGL